MIKNNSDNENYNIRGNKNILDNNQDKKNEEYDILEDLKKERENYNEEGNEDNILNDLKKNRDENQINENDYDNNKIQNEINTNEIEYPEDFYQKPGSGFNRIYLNSFKNKRNTKTLIREDDKLKEDILDLYV